MTGKPTLHPSEGIYIVGAVDGVVERSRKTGLVYCSLRKADGQLMIGFLEHPHGRGGGVADGAFWRVMEEQSTPVPGRPRLWLEDVLLQSDHQWFVPCLHRAMADSAFDIEGVKRAYSESHQGAEMPYWTREDQIRAGY